jgi:RNA polymerase sigma factor (sigma-70 family)
VNPSKFQHLSDQELLQFFYTTQNNEWLGHLLQRYTLLLFGVCHKYLKNEAEAKDSVQQIFLKVMEEMHKYKVEYFKSWLYMVAKNHCLMRLRHMGRVVGEVKEHMASSEEAASKNEHWEKEQLINKMGAALLELNEGQRICVELFYLQKKSYADISEQTGYDLLKVKSHIQNGKRNLKLLLEKTGKGQ